MSRFASGLERQPERRREAARAAIGVVVLCAAPFLAAGCAHSSSGPANPGSSPTVLIRDGLVVDPARRTIARESLLIRDGRILAVYAPPSEPPSDLRATEVIDAATKWVIPGLVDLHVHSWGDPAPDGRSDDEVGTEGVARLVLKAGVTALLDLGGPESETLPARDRLRASEGEGAPHARFFAAGPVFIEASPARLKRLGHRRGMPGMGARFVAGPADARRQVRELVARRQPDVIKIIFDHSGGHGSMSLPTMRSIVDEARRLGLKSVVHIGSWEDARAAILAGASAVTHLSDDDPIPGDLPALYASHGTVSIPTMAVQCDFARFAGNKEALADPLLAAVTTERLRAAYLNERKFTERARFWREWQADDCRANDLPSLKKLAAAGVTILAGSDSGNLGVFEGYSVHRELALMVEAGVDSWTALAAATTGAGRFLGRRFGVEPGDEADLVVLGGDPVADIANTKKIERVLVGGR